MIRAAMLGGAMIALAAPAAALAQDHGDHAHHGTHEEHGQHGAPAPSPSPSPSPSSAHSPSSHTACTPEHAAMGHCEMPAAAPHSHAAGACTTEHEAMGHCTRQPSPAPAAGNAPAPHPVAADYANRIWGAGAMAPSQDALRRDHGGGTYSLTMIDLAELRFADGGEAYHWDAEFSTGGDIGRFVLKSTGEGDLRAGSPHMQFAALYSHAIGPYFDLRGGVRQDAGPGPDRTYAALGLEGHAPYLIEVETYLYLSTEGELLASASAEYDQRITQRLILQPKLEIDMAAQDSPELGLGAGFTKIEAGLRLRYEIAREFAPYVGIVHEARLGQTADFARAAGEDAATTSLVAGIRAWF